MDPGMRGQGGAQGTFPYPSRDGGEGGEEAGHVPTGVTLVLVCHREAFVPRQRDFDTPGTAYHQRRGWQGRR